MTDCGDYLLPLRSIRVTELHRNVTEGLLFKQFSPIGPILSLHLHKDSVTQKCNGVAHITYYRSNDAQQAFDKLNNTVIMGHPMMLYWAEEDIEKVKYRVESFLVENLVTDDDESVEALFACFGKILYCMINRDSEGNSLSTAYVHYKSGCRLKDLMAINGTDVIGGKIAVQHIKAPDDVPFTNIYVKHLSSNVENVDLHKMFIEFGAINSCMVMKHPDGRSRQFGFVNFEEAQAAKNAVDKMHLSSTNSERQIMLVTRADIKPTIPSSLRKFEEQVGKPLLSYLFVDNIGANVTELQVRREFERFRNLKGVKCSNHKNKYYAYVIYGNSGTAEQAVRLMAESINIFRGTGISVLNRFDHPSFFSQTCAVPIIARALYTPEVDLSWEVFWQVYVVPTCEKDQKWRVYQLCRAETT